MINERLFFIAEAGVNHNGSLETALRLVDAAAAAGADAVKFQTFKASQLVTANAGKADYQKKALSDEPGGQLEMLRALELDEGAHRAILEHCQALGIEFMSTPFDIGSARFLVNELGMRRIKVSSGDLTNAPFLHALAKFHLPIILSTGMATLQDIEQALSVIAHSLVSSEAPSRAAFRAAYNSSEGQAALSKWVSLLHCTTEYPAPDDAVNLRAMDTLAASFGLATGYSDHTLGTHVALAAAARGAQIIEKHFTLDRTMPGPDHGASLEPSELKDLVSNVRKIGLALGGPRKILTAAEEQNRQVACKSIVAAKPIRAGERFTTDNLAIKRPLGGEPPISWWDLIGKIALRDFDIDQPVTRDG